MTNPAIARQCCFFLLAAVLITEAGCVSRHAYEKARAEADDLSRTLDIARTDVSELDRQIAELQAANRQEDAATTGLRAAIQREQDQWSVLRQRADAQLASLQAQVAHLINQGRALTRQIADAKRESASLHAMATQYKQELDEAQAMPAPIPTMAAEPIMPRPAMTSGAPSVMPGDPGGVPQQTAQVAPVAAPKPVIPPPPANAEPAPVDDSWTGMLASWFSMLWSWIFG